MTRLITAIAASLSVSVGALAQTRPQRPPQTPPPQPAPEQPTAAKPATPAASPYEFPTGVGMFLFYVKPDKAADFEGVLGKITEALDKSQDSGRKQQATNWRMYKSAETQKDSVVYVFMFDPAITTADYDPVRLLGEAHPADVQSLYDRLKDDVIKVERMGLTKLR